MKLADVIRGMGFKPKEVTLINNLWSQFFFADFPIITCQSEPTIRVAFGSRLRLYCDGVGVPAPSFQWYKNNAPIEGATFRELTKLSVTSEDQGNYFCKVYNSAGEVSSDLIQVIVAPAGTIKLLFIVIHVFMSCLLKNSLLQVQKPKLQQYAKNEVSHSPGLNRGSENSVFIIFWRP